MNHPIKLQSGKKGGVKLRGQTGVNAPQTRTYLGELQDRQPTCLDLAEFFCKHVAVVYVSATLSVKP